MNKHQKRERVLAIKHRQLARRRSGPTLPEASPDELARHHRESERLSLWQRLKNFFGVG